MHISFERTGEETPLGTVLLSHGYAEHSGRYVHLRSALTRAGYDVAFYDHAGHGTSEGPRARVDVGTLIRDFGDARRATLAHARTPDLFLFGHSMGGIIAAASTILDPTRLRGTVLSAPALRPLPHVSPSRARKLLPVARISPGLVVTKGASEMKVSPLSRDPQVQRDFDADPLTYKGGVPILTGATMILQGDEVLRRADRLTTPTLVMHGSGDLLADLRGSRDFVRAARGAHPDADVHLRIVDGAYHELINEPEGPGLIRDIIIWLGEH
ncbi:alpha/beta hydrolase [Actinomyces sp.]